MSFTVLRVEVQQWEDESVFFPAGGQSEEGVEADDVVEEEGHQEDCGHLGMREDTVLSVFIFRAEGHRILYILLIDIYQMVIPSYQMVIIVSTAWWWFVQFDHQNDITGHVCCREDYVQ